HNGVVVVEEELGPLACVVRRAQLEAGGVVLPRLVDTDEAGGARKVIDDPLHHVPILDELPSPLHTGTVDLEAAEGRALHVLSHRELEARRLDAVAAEDLADV